ncbi:PKD domain-containing protein [candidate division KSB1 bacterium]|nr:PKD domain-containing protein [candidate division KSB1 bacterium]
MIQSRIQNTIRLIGIPLLFFLMVSSAWAQAPQWCDFWGQGEFEGTPVGAGHTIGAYNSSGQLCGEATGTAGWFNLRVHGVYSGSPYYPNGASEGDTLTFKINGSNANWSPGTQSVPKKDNVWQANGSSNIDLDVPDEIIVVANPGGPYSGQEGSVIQFNGSGSQDAITYSWNFGDGNTGSGVSPTHTYLDNNTYTVTLTCTNGALSDDGATTATISNVAPTASAGNDKSGNEGQVLSFAGGATDPGTNDVLTYSWNFGDGQTASGQNVTHAYADNFIYTVTLTVNDDDGGSDTDQLTATIANLSPTAEAGGPYSGILNQAVQLYGSASDPGSADVSSLAYAWDLDNDGVYDDATGANPAPTFSSEGTYPISLRVTDKDGASDTDGSSIAVANGVQIVVTTSPSGRLLIIDGTTHATPASFYWVPGSHHTVEAISPQSAGTGVRFVYSTWSDGGQRVHTYITPSSNASITANFDLQYALTVESDHGDSYGGGWFFQGTTATFGVTTPDEDPGGTRYTLIEWTGSGTGSYSGTNPENSVAMNNAITETADWNVEYFLATAVDPIGAGTVSPAPPGAWYAASATANVSADPVGDFEWIGWGGDLTGTTTPTTLLMNEPKSVVANFQGQVTITLSTDPAGLSYFVDGTEYTETESFVWLQGSTHTFSTTSPQPGAAGVQYLYSQWSDGGAQEHTYTVPVLDEEVTAEFTLQYYLTVDSDRGNPTGEGWYNANSMASFSVDSLDQISADERYQFNHWEGDGPNSYNGDELSPSILMVGPVTQEAFWSHQYYVSLAVEPDTAGTIQPLSVPGGWAIVNQQLTLTAIGNIDAGYGFSHWEGDDASTDNPLHIVIDNPVSLTAHFIMGAVRISSDPLGLLVVVDGEEITTPRVYSWLPGEIHELGVVTPQGDSASAVYSFSNWSDEGAPEHTITIEENLEIYKAFYDAAYMVRVETDYGTPILNGEMVDQGLFDEGSRITVSIDSLVSITDEIRRRFNSWTGTGSGSVSSSNREIEIEVNAPITERTNWITQYKLKARKNPSHAPGSSIVLNPTGPWFDQNQVVTAIAVIIDTSYTFLGWSGAVSSSNDTLSFTMIGPMEIIASFDTPNQPPAIDGVPLLDLVEDETGVLSLEWLMSFISDPNDPIDSLDIEFKQGNHVVVQIDTPNQMIYLFPEAEWSGMDGIEITATDPFGESDTETVIVRILSSPDRPLPFEALYPANDTVFTEWSLPVEFLWQSSLNVDEGDSIQYTFYMGPSENLMSAGTFRIVGIEDTTILLPPQASNTYYWGVRANDTQENYTWCTEVFQIHVMTSVMQTPSENPKSYRLAQNYPNPFNPETVIPYDLPKESNVAIRIFDTTGRLVRTLMHKTQEAGYHQIIWDGMNTQAQQVASGVYVIHMQAGDFVHQRKIVLIR